MVVVVCVFAIHMYFGGTVCVCFCLLVLGSFVLPNLLGPEPMSIILSLSGCFLFLLPGTNSSFHSIRSTASIRIPVFYYFEFGRFRVAFFSCYLVLTLVSIQFVLPRRFESQFSRFVAYPSRV
jgi:hypothetical protein